MCTVHNSIQCMVYSVLYIQVCSVQCSLHTSVQCTMYTEHRIVHTSVQCTVYRVYSMQPRVQTQECIVYTSCSVKYNVFTLEFESLVPFTLGALGGCWEGTTYHYCTCTVLYCTLLHLYCTVLHSTVLYVHHCAVVYCTVL